MKLPLPVVRWTGSSVRLIDQTRLPGEFVHRDCETVDALCQAIVELAVRGAPAIGIAAAYGMVLSRHLAAPDADLAAHLARDRQQLAATRPTAVNLFWALDRMDRVAAADPSLAALLAEAEAIHAEDVAMGRAIGQAGQELLPPDATILTHCNAGALATGGYGTALAPVYAAREAGKTVRVYADETRPLLQGARLTAWELQALGIPVTVLPDAAAATLLRRGTIDAVITGADRIAANGDVANKIGTYPLAVLAHRHGVPFYVAAPTSTIDPATATGAGIEIEQRDPEEVFGFGGVRVTPDGVAACNPAFDVTPSELVTAILTEKGVQRPPYRFGPA
jgi:methylthioribose-1-phosphate isomerase